MPVNTFLQSLHLRMVLTSADSAVLCCRCAVVLLCRLILSDAIYEAACSSPDVLIDAATLTGTWYTHHTTRARNSMPDC
jgi:hypothetical protein